MEIVPDIRIRLGWYKQESNENMIFPLPSIFLHATGVVLNGQTDS